MARAASRTPRAREELAVAVDLHYGGREGAPVGGGDGGGGDGGATSSPRSCRPATVASSGAATASRRYSSSTFSPSCSRHVARHKAVRLARAIFRDVRRYLTALLSTAMLVVLYVVRRYEPVLLYKKTSRRAPVVGAFTFNFFINLHLSRFSASVHHFIHPHLLFPLSLF